MIAYLINCKDIETISRLLQTPPYDVSIIPSNPHMAMENIFQIVQKKKIKDGWDSME